MVLLVSQPIQLANLFVPQTKVNAVTSVYSVEIRLTSSPTSCASLCNSCSLTDCLHNPNNPTLVVREHITLGLFPSFFQGVCKMLLVTLKFKRLSRQGGGGGGGLRLSLMGQVNQKKKIMFLRYLYAEGSVLLDWFCIFLPYFFFTWLLDIP